MSEAMAVFAEGKKNVGFCTGQWLVSFQDFFFKTLIPGSLHSFDLDRSFHRVAPDEIDELINYAVYRFSLSSCVYRSQLLASFLIQ